MARELYQIGIATERLSTAFMLWDSYGRPGKMLISPAKNEELAVLELRDAMLSQAIINTVPDALVKIVDIPEKIVKL